VIRDPEELRETRQQRRAPAPLNEPPQGSVESFELERTMQRLAAERACDDMARPRQWLCRVRGDLRPGSVCELHEAIATVASENGVTLDVVRRELDRALVAEGGNLEQWEQQLRRPRPRLGKASPPATELEASQRAHRQGHLALTQTPASAAGNPTVAP
jgi:hypothetical protein